MYPEPYPDPAQKLTYQTDDKLYFYLGSYDAMGNFSAHAVEIWGKVFPTVEHAFQWKKFEGSNEQSAQKILEAKSAWLARKIGRELRGMSQDWREARINAMTDIIRAKFTQHEDARLVLLATSPKMIIENSPIDDYWGCGPDGKGQNHMGEILVKIREEIRKGST